MKIILFQPQIPQNTGNIVRTCSVTGCGLILVRPLGFSISSRMVKRSGLDYWDEVKIEEIEDLFSFLSETESPFHFFSSKSEKTFTNAGYRSDSLLIFGSETSGLPSEFRQKWPEKFLKIPMLEKSRCLNLSNSVAIAIYEALRQQDFEGLK